MKKINRNLLVFVAVALVAGSFAFLAFAGAGHNVGGFAWSENIGWVSFNNGAVDGVAGAGGETDYGVNIASDKKMSGYAWSEYIGWISFNVTDVAGCGGCSGDDCQAKVSGIPNASGNHEISGWAKVLASGSGWDGCVSLRGTTSGGSPYGVSIDPATGDFHGWAWSDVVLGWLSFNSVDPGAGGRPYKVHTSAKFGPTAKMECGGAGADCAYGTCDNSPGGTWIAYSPTQECPICIYPVTDKSEPEGNVASAQWTLIGPATYSYSSGPGQTINLSGFANKIVPGDYTLWLEVSDKWGNTDKTSHAITIKQGVDANFRCALGDPIYDEETNPEPAPWQDCTSSAGQTEFAKRIIKGGKIYIEDISLHSEEGTDIVNWNWRITVDRAESTDNEEMVDFTAGKNNKIELKVFDNGGRTNCKSVDFTARSLPKWEEVPI